MFVCLYPEQKSYKLHAHRTLQPLTPIVSSKSAVNSFFGYMFQLFIKASFVMFFITQDVW